MSSNPESFSFQLLFPIELLHFPIFATDGTCWINLQITEPDAPRGWWFSSIPAPLRRCGNGSLRREHASNAFVFCLFPSGT